MISFLVSRFANILCMLKTRYKFVKRLYRDYIIIFKQKKYNYIYNYEFLSLFKDKISIINKLNKYHINYLIVDNMKIVDIITFKDNKYNSYKKKYLIYKIIMED